MYAFSRAKMVSIAETDVGCVLRLVGDPVMTRSREFLVQQWIHPDPACVAFHDLWPRQLAKPVRASLRHRRVAQLHERAVDLRETHFLLFQLSCQVAFYLKMSSASNSRKLLQKLLNSAYSLLQFTNRALTSTGCN
jgi:hypothetical protein